MSYEGYQEWLCTSGHYLARDAYEDAPPKCPHCRGALAYYHAVDQTNGEEEGNPSTLPAPKEQVGADDQWHMDHRGNRYVTPLERYRPVSEWRNWQKPTNS